MNGHNITLNRGELVPSMNAINNTKPSLLLIQSKELPMANDLTHERKRSTCKCNSQLSQGRNSIGRPTCFSNCITSFHLKLSTENWTPTQPYLMKFRQIHLNINAGYRSYGENFHIFKICACNIHKCMYPWYIQTENISIDFSTLCLKVIKAI